MVLTYSARGFGNSGGLIHFAAPNYEVHDGKLLIDYLAGLKQVVRKDGKPQIAVAGSSYGGALSLLIAGADQRVRAVAADITWNDLSHALFPNFGATTPGVFKKLWAGLLFGNAVNASTSITALLGEQRADGASGSAGCGNFAPDVCAAYQASAATGTPTAAMRALMRRASPAAVLDRIDAPTLLTQGEQDSLFPLSEADANARGIAAHGTPVRVVWRPGGHDDGSVGGDTATSEAIDWFDTAFRERRVDTSAVPVRRAGRRGVGRHRRRVRTDPSGRRAIPASPARRVTRRASGSGGEPDHRVAGGRRARRDHQHPRAGWYLQPLRSSADELPDRARPDRVVRVARRCSTASSSPASRGCAS